MERNRKTVIITGASQGIGAGIAQAFLARDYNVVGTARSATRSKELSASEHLALIDGDIGEFETAQKGAQLAIKRFGSIDAVVANAGIFLVKPFTEYTADDFRALVSTNLAGFAVPKERWQHREHQRRAGRQSNRWHNRFPFHDH
jgi:NAD(P)-dependent dehydrogenase (short-subunit alcohol dehydrogenase family)